MIYSTATAILSSVYPSQRRGKVIGINTTATYIGFAVGPLGGGVLAHHFGWPAIFYFAFIVAATVLLLTLIGIKGEWAEARGESFDKLGTALYMVGMVAFIYGFSAITTSSWAKYLLITGIVFIALFVRQELRAEQPILNIGFFKGNTSFVYANLAALIYFITTYTVTFLLSLHLQVVVGYNPQIAGLILLAQPLVMAMLSPGAGMLSDRTEPRMVAACGISLAALGLAVFAFISPGMPIWLVVGNLMILGTGAAFFSSPNTNALMGSVPQQFYGVASSTLGTMRNTGQAISMATVAMLMNLYIGSAPVNPSIALPLEKSIRLSFVFFALASCGGIWASLARGNTNTPVKRSALSQEHGE